ncbi:transposase for transposon [Streptomyces laurentii]|uniref:Transposase for transposon n=1 Tax=Streptomyces laurentii TaxID=39478 RepID=A0A169PJT4_STRLU|nr:transposase for transposon [Streptomyces laurentii]
MDAWAWPTGDGPKVRLDAAAGWLRGRRVLLPRTTTLTRPAGTVREAVNQRLWDTLFVLLHTGQRAVLDSLLTVPPGERVSEVDRLRRGPVRVSGPQMKWALKHAEGIAALGMGDLDVSAIPPRRPAELPRYEVNGARHRCCAGTALCRDRRDTQPPRPTSETARSEAGCGSTRRRIRGAVQFPFPLLRPGSAP